MTLAFVIPIPFLAMHLWLRRPEWFAPSGAITLFLVGVVQFKQLGMLENKHITNAERASRGESVQLLSEEYRRLEVRSFWAALLGTGIWAYGDKIVSCSFSQPRHNIECERTVGLHSLTTAAQRYLQEETTEDFCFATSKHLQGYESNHLA